MRIKRIEIEYEDGSSVTMTPQLLADEFIRFLSGVRVEPQWLVYGPTWKRCGTCNATGKVGSKYCHCQMGRDLAVVERRDYYGNTVGGQDG